MNSASISIDGFKVSGFKSIKVVKSMEELAHSFQFVMHGPGMNVDNIPLYTGGLVRIRLNDKLLMTGYIETTNVEVGIDSVTMEISGRSKTCDLIDCCQITDPYTWRKVNINTIISALTAPFGIKVIDEVKDTFNFTEVSIGKSEKILSFIRKLANQRGLLLQTDEKGDLVITNSGSTRSANDLDFGVNQFKCKGMFDNRERYSIYQVKTQEKVKPGESGWTIKEIDVTAEAKDENVERYRPLVIRPRRQLTQDEAEKRVNWETQVRSGRSTKVVITVPEWQQSDKSFWDVNTLTWVRNNLLKLDQEMLINSVEYNLFENKSSTRLTLCDASTFAPNPTDIVRNKNKTKRVSVYGWF